MYCLGTSAEKQRWRFQNFAGWLYFIYCIGIIATIYSYGTGSNVNTRSSAIGRRLAQVRIS